jgi:hypothetical protein
MAVADPPETSAVALGNHRNGGSKSRLLREGGVAEGD